MKEEHSKQSRCKNNVRILLKRLQFIELCPNLLHDISLYMLLVLQHHILLLHLIYILLSAPTYDLTRTDFNTSLLHGLPIWT